jgi:hypothetical protein
MFTHLYSDGSSNGILTMTDPDVEANLIAVTYVSGHPITSESNLRENVIAMIEEEHPTYVQYDVDSDEARSVLAIAQLSSCESLV